MTAAAQDKGKIAEQLACRYLEQQGLKLLEQNYRCRYGEIDLIMSDKHTTVFVEVRARKDKSLVDSLHSVDIHKQNKLIRTAQIYLQAHPKLADNPARFDVIAITQQMTNNQINWIKDAFQT